MPKPPPSFTAEFKKEAVQLAYTSGKPKAQIARELGISDSALQYVSPVQFEQLMC
jgi:transposase